MPDLQDESLSYHLFTDMSETAHKDEQKWQSIDHLDRIVER